MSLTSRDSKSPQMMCRVTQFRRHIRQGLAEPSKTQNCWKCCSVHLHYDVQKLSYNNLKRISSIQVKCGDNVHQTLRISIPQPSLSPSHRHSFISAQNSEAHTSDLVILRPTPHVHPLSRRPSQPYPTNVNPTAEVSPSRRGLRLTLPFEDDR